MEHPAPLRSVEHPVTMAMRNLLLPPPVTLVMVHRQGSIVAAAQLGHTHFFGGFVGNTGTITGQGTLEEIQLGIS